MQDHRNGGPPSRLPDPDSIEYRAQRLVLLELVVDPPRAGDPLSELVRLLGRARRARSSRRSPRSSSSGLAEREGDVVRATASARYFEYLWPVRL